MQIAENKPRLLILLLSGLSLTTRLLFLGSKSFWIDECLAWGAVRMDWLEMFSSVASGTPHPPFAFAVMKISSMLLGESEFGLRFLTAVLVASAVIPVFRLAARRINVRGAFWSGVVFALCPFTVSLGQEAWVYGINLAVTLWFADVADLAWRGSKKALIGTLLLGTAGILTQHIFLISIAVSCILYLSISPDERIPFKRFVIVPALLALFYTPVFLFFSSQFAARSSRMAAAGSQSGLSRFFILHPLSQFFRLLYGGVLPEISKNLLDRPRMMLAYLGNAGVILFLAFWPFFARILKPFDRKYLWLALVLPFALYITGGPAIRQLSVLWVPFAITSAAVFSRFRFSGIVVSLLCLFALVPYYRMNAFPYHPSDWRTAVATVESLAEVDDMVVVFGGKSTSLAWEYYSATELNHLTPAGYAPFAEDNSRDWIDPERFLDSLLTVGGHDRVWVILDIWGIPSVCSVKGQHTIEFFLPISEKMEVVLLNSAR